jgi:hypothetical protein
MVEFTRMYHLIRRIHLYSSLVIIVFLMMYFVSGYMMTHVSWFPSSNHPEPVQTANLESSPDRPAEQVAADVKNQLHLPGRIQFPVTQPAGMTRFWINHPGTMTRVDVSTADGVIRVFPVHAGLIGALVMLHKVAGYDNQPAYNLCALFCDLCGVSMILFALTGVYLWWMRTKNHLWGILCLIASCAYAAGILLYLAYAP